MDKTRLKQETRTKGFKVHDMIVSIEDGHITICKDNNTVIVTVQEFIHNLRGVLKKLTV